MILKYDSVRYIVCVCVYVWGGGGVGILRVGLVGLSSKVVCKFSFPISDLT